MSIEPSGSVFLDQVAPRLLYAAMFVFMWAVTVDLWISTSAEWVKVVITLGSVMMTMFAAWLELRPRHRLTRRE